MVLVAGTVATATLWGRADRLGLIVLLVVGHFFLFCNVFRVSRRLELAWALVFVVCTWLAISALLAWWAAIALVIASTVVALAIAIRHPSYHGIGWQRLNPNLRAWWVMAEGAVSR